MADFSTRSEFSTLPPPTPPIHHDYDDDTMTVLLNGTHDISIGLQQS